MRANHESSKRNKPRKEFLFLIKKMAPATLQQADTGMKARQRH
jgi:hypothetical protein